MHGSATWLLPALGSCLAVRADDDQARLKCVATVPGLRTYTETVHLNVDCKLLLAAQTPLRYCAVLLCPDRVCLSVYVCPSANMSPELQVRSLLDLIFVHVTGGRGSVLLWRRCEILWTSGG